MAFFKKNDPQKETAAEAAKETEKKQDDFFPEFGADYGFGDFPEISGNGATPAATGFNTNTAPKRELDVLYVIDTSGSMRDTKIKTVNQAMHMLEPLLCKEADKNYEAEVMVRVLEFGNRTTKWNVEKRTPVKEFKYKDITDVVGSTPLGTAMGVLVNEFESIPSKKKLLPPVVVLLSDGYPDSGWEPNMEKFLNLPWGARAIKVAIGIGAKYDKDVLAKFTTKPDLVLDAKTVDQLIAQMQWTSTLISTSSDLDAKGGENGNITITPPPSSDTVLDDTKNEFL